LTPTLFFQQSYDLVSYHQMLAIAMLPSAKNILLVISVPFHFVVSKEQVASLINSSCYKK